MRFSLESEDGEVDVLVFTEVSNAEHIRSQILTGTIEAALLDASLVSSSKFRAKKTLSVFLTQPKIPDIFLVLVATSNAMRKRKFNIICITDEGTSSTYHSTRVY